MPQGSASSRFESLSATPFYLGFVVCGFATCLLGPVLPVLSLRWPMSDMQRGWLFVAQFMASTCGSVTSSYAPRKSAALGCAAIAAGLALLTASHYGAAIAAFALIGVGFGATVSATNLVFGTEHPEQRGKFLTQVNLCWGIGAMLVPAAVALAVRMDAVRIFLLTAALLALLVFVTLSPLLRPGEPRRNTAVAPGVPIGARLFVLFSAMLFLYVGAETAATGWAATYAHRLRGLSVESASLLVSAFWVSLVVGRSAGVWLLRKARERTVLFGSLAVAGAGVLMLMASQTAMVPAAMVVTGLGCAPVYPLLLSRVLGRIGRSRHAGWIFAICGSGGAVIPWITGAVSQHATGLRGAFLVPLAAFAGVALCVLASDALPMRRP